MDKKLRRAIHRRILPLYIAAFFHGLVLWYAIEKLFMHKIGFSDAGIGLMVAAYSTLILVIETPSGILADRWSRKGVLMLASIFLALSGLICGMSSEPTLYIGGALLWGAFYAMYSGTYDSVIYDVVKEETGEGESYDVYYGRYKVVDGVALVLGALVGGVIGQWANLPLTYYMSVPLALLALFALWRFKEPQLYKIGQSDSVKDHIVETFRLVLGRPALLPLAGLVAIILLMIEMIYEFSQLWFIATHTPPVLFGVVYGTVLAAMGVGGYIVSFIPSHSVKVIWFGLALTLASSGMLALVPNTFVILAAQFMLAAGLVALSAIVLRDLHNALPSRVRAGASSALNTVMRLMLIPASLLFGWLSAEFTIFMAAWVLVAFAALACMLQFIRRPVVLRSDV